MGNFDAGQLYRLVTENAIEIFEVSICDIEILIWNLLERATGRIRSDESAFCLRHGLVCGDIDASVIGINNPYFVISTYINMGPVALADAGNV